MMSASVKELSVLVSVDDALGNTKMSNVRGPP